MSGPVDEDADDTTLWAGRLRAWPAADVDAPAETDDDADQTRIVRRSTAVDPDPTDSSAPPIADDTVIAARSVIPDDTVARPRTATGASAPGTPAEAIDEGTVIRPRGAVPAVAPTEAPPTRRAASARIAAPADTPRNARVPQGMAREIYKPRAPEPVMVARQVPVPVPGAGGPAPDASIAQRRQRVARRRFVVTAVVVGILAFIALAAAGVLLLLP